MQHPSAQEEISHRRVLNIAVPVVISNATVPLLGAVDTGVVGQMGAAAPIAAVAIGANILSSLYWIFGFLRMGTTGLAGQAFGAGDQAEGDALLARALVIAALGGVLCMILSVPILWIVANVIAPAPEVTEMATTYIAIRIWSAPAAVAIFGVIGWLVALERTRGVLVLQVWMNGLNILLDLWFVLGLGWGVGGVAFATLIAEWSGLALGLWFCRDALRRPHWLNWGLVSDRVRLLRMMLVNMDILIRSVLILAALQMFVLVFSARFGTVTLAANQVLLQFLFITSYALDGFAFSVEALVARAVGLRRADLVGRATALNGVWALGACILLTVCFWVFGESLIALMATSEAVRGEAGQYLPWLVATPILAVGAFVLDGVFIGATRSVDMRNMMIVSFVIYCVALAALVPVFENHGLWAALLVFYVARGLTLAWRYPRVVAATR
ncbi:MAG: MATE family efflux transporter [Pseudomonadota bacterium]